MGLITVHYRDVNRPTQDINKISVQKPKGTAFNVKKYVNRVPMQPRPYYFSKVVKSASTFTKQPQDVIIFVRAYLRARLVFKDIHNHKVVASHYLYAREVGKSLNYAKLGHNYMPAHYRFLKPAKKDSSIFIPGMTNVIYVQRIQPKPNPQPKSASNSSQSQSQAQSQNSNTVTGRLYYVDAKTGSRKKVIPIHGIQDQRINYSRYQTSAYLPHGYVYDRLGANTGRFLEPNAEYSIVVKHPKPVTGTILYRDVDDNQVKKTQKITGHPGQSIASYLTANSKFIPKGYHFLRFRSQNGTQLKDQAVYIVLVQHDHVTGDLIYRDQATGHPLKHISISGNPGMSIPVERYKTLNRLPHGYRYSKLGSTDWHLKAGQKYCIWVKSHHQPQSEAAQKTQSNSASSNVRHAVKFSASSSAKTKSQSTHSKHHDYKLNLPKVHNDNNIGSILMALGSSLSALGSALAHKKNDNENHVNDHK